MRSQNHLRSHSIVMLRIFVSLGVLCIGFVLLLKILFPTDVQTFDFDNPSALEHRLTLEERSDPTTGFFAGEIGTYSTIDLSLKARAGVDLSSEIVRVRSIYQALSYPIKQEIASIDSLSIPSQPYPPGSLLTRDNSVFLVGLGSYAPIESAESFVSFGYKWEDVVPGKSNLLSELTKKRLHRVSDPHPMGTHFLDELGQVYYVFDHTLYPIASFGGKGIVFDSKDVERYQTCELKRTFFGHYRCRLHVSSLSHRYNSYHIELVSIPPQNLDSVKVTLTPSYSRETLERSLGLIKHRVLVRFGIIKE